MRIEEVVADVVHTDAEVRTQEEAQRLKETAVTEMRNLTTTADKTKIVTARMRLWTKVHHTQLVNTKGAS